MYTCSCVDAAIHSTVCKHIHMSKSSKVAVSSVSEEACCSTQLHEVTDTETIADSQYSPTLTNVSDASFIGKCVIHTSDSDLAIQKKKATEGILELQALVQSSVSVDAVTTVRKHINNAISLMKCLKGDGPSRIPVKRHLEPRTTPQKQLRFFSVKRQRVSSQMLSKPCLEKIQDSQHILDTVIVQVCGICFREEDREGSTDYVDWVCCANCDIWMHKFCSVKIQVI